MRLRTLCVCLFTLAVSLIAKETPDNAEDIFDRARQLIAEQLVQTLNYACVQTIERSFYAEASNSVAGCAVEFSKTHPIMKDRLRLDVAVSNGQEIYSWHGASKFSSTRVSEIVQTGPTSSGSFFGYLANIFVKGGARVSYTGRSEIEGVPVVTFSFTMPREMSRYKVDTQNGDVIIPYRGMFAIDARTYALVRLKIKGDDLPRESRMCSANTEVNYQRVNVAGRPAVIPGFFELRIDGRNGISSASDSRYTSCREFRGESTLLFDSDVKLAKPAVPSAPERQLPAGIKFHAALKNPIDDRNSYTGDSVEAVLLDRLKIEGISTIPKGATLHGLIEKFELHYTPHPYYLASILFDRLTGPDASYVLKARPITSHTDIQKMTSIYGRSLTDLAIRLINRGVIVSTSSHIHLENRLPSEWITLNVHQPLSPQ